MLEGDPLTCRSAWTRVRLNPLEAALAALFACNHPQSGLSYIWSRRETGAEPGCPGHAGWVCVCVGEGGGGGGSCHADGHRVASGSPPYAASGLQGGGLNHPGWLERTQHSHLHFLLPQ